MLLGKWEDFNTKGGAPFILLLNLYSVIKLTAFSKTPAFLGSTTRANSEAFGKSPIKTICNDLSVYNDILFTPDTDLMMNKD